MLPIVIISITGIIALLLLILYIYLVIIKVKNTRLAKKKQMWIDEQLPEIEAYLLTGNLEQASFIPKEPYQYSALEDFFSYYLMNYKVDPEHDPIKQFVEHYFLDEYRKRLNHRKWSVRMNTLHFFDLFKLEKVQDDLLERLKSPDLTSEEEYQIFILLASLEYENLYELFKQSKGLPPFLLNVMLNRLVHEENIDQYLASFDELHQSWQLGILDLIRNKNLRTLEITKFLESLLSSQDRELRIRALKTIAHIGYVSSKGLIQRWYKENSERGDWEQNAAAGERLMFARLMGMIKDEQYLPFLKQLITDRNYNVRAEAAKAIRKYKDGKRYLMEIATKHTDKYSRSIAMEWVERSLDYE